MTRPSATTAGAIVLGGNYIGLGVVRSLGTHKIPTWVLESETASAIAKFSRYTKRFVRTREDKLEWLLTEPSRSNVSGWVLFPVTDADVELLATNHEALSSVYRVTTPPLAVTKYALDKRLTYRQAAAVGIDTPWTMTCDSAPARIAGELPYPVILKPAVNHHFFPKTSVKAVPVASAAEFERSFAQMTKYIPAEEILIQERIEGTGQNQFSFAAIAEDGETYASLVARRTRQYPIDFGNGSTFVETIDQPTVATAGKTFLNSIGFDGMAEIEFKFDAKDQKYKLLDFNCRPWGWHTLGKKAGIDFSYLLWRQKVGLPIVAMRAQRYAAWFRELNDFLAIAQSPHRASEFGRLMNAVGSGGFTPATFDLLDPVPFLAEFALHASQGLSAQKRARELRCDRFLPSERL